MPCERLLWTGRSAISPRTRYGLSDLRVVRIDGDEGRELALYDVGRVHLSRSWLQRLLGTSTITIHARDRRRRPVSLAHLRRAAPIAAALELLAGDPLSTLDAEELAAALHWTPPVQTRPSRHEWLAAVFGLVAALSVVVIGLQGQTPSAVAYPSDDAIAPGGVKRDRAEIVEYMETAVMPWARVALAPIVGGPDRVTCETCHGGDAAAREWQMPAVAVLPQPIVRQLGWEQYSRGMDPQLRNAIYGYSAGSEKQSKAGYMREVVMPGMAGLLHRPAYDFTRTYDYNRTHQAFGCYHCHRVR
jgi:hypothetical protein